VGSRLYVVPLEVSPLITPPIPLSKGMAAPLHTSGEAEVVGVADGGNKDGDGVGLYRASRGPNDVMERNSVLNADVITGVADQVAVGQ
jgi:hypothetical protein